jgi:ABC-type dipeptide/oligopeptide/nickel transport system permease component
MSLLLGVLAALWRNSIFDRASNALALTAISFPEFFVAYILVLWLAQGGLFPSMVRITSATTTGDLLYLGLSARADADARRHRAHDADDAGRDHQPAWPAPTSRWRG